MKINNNGYDQSATQLVAALANKTISSVELVEKAISRIERLDEKINAVVVRDFERARIAAKAADRAIAQGQRLPLLGLPITVKESFNIAGLPTSWGSPEYKDWYPDEDALAVSRLKAAGAIIIGKTNVPRMLMDWQCYNEVYGTTNNPWDLQLTPGGSSGGSAAALAAGFVSLELGSDFAGSIRIPANFCGIFGHKPSVNLIPMRGAASPASPPSPHLLNPFVVAGPMARTASDLALALKILSGPDEIWDGKGYQLHLPPARQDHFRNFRVLVINTHPLCSTATAITNAIDHLAECLSQWGAQVSCDTHCLPDLAEITRIYVTLFAAFAASSLPMEVYRRFETAAKMLPPNDMSLTACFLRGSQLSYRDWLMKMRARGMPGWRNLFKEFDVVICPVTPTVAFPHDHSAPENRVIEIDGISQPYNEQYAWISIATLFGLPVTVVPIGHTENGLPIGVQVMGDYLEDLTTIQFATLLERQLNSFSMPPDFRV